RNLAECVRRGRVCAASAACGIGGLGGRTKGCPVGLFLAADHVGVRRVCAAPKNLALPVGGDLFRPGTLEQADAGHAPVRAAADGLDRKSTRLNSSHRTISYAVFCLKKKKNRNNRYNDKDLHLSIQSYCHPL